MNQQLDQLAVEPISGLHYRVRPAISTDSKAPCLILLHGVGSNEAGFIDLASSIDPHMTVVLVRGPLEFGPMQYGWFQVRFTPEGPLINPQQADASRQQLIRFVEQLPEECQIDPKRIVIAGFSQGGILSASVGLTAPDKVCGFGILSGRILREVLPTVKPGAVLSRVRAFVGHGNLDEKLNIHFARDSRAILQDYSVALDYREYPAGHVLAPQMLEDFVHWLAPLLDAKPLGTEV